MGKDLSEIIEFPEGNFLLIGDHPYFQPAGSATAYATWGDHKELLGKNHHKLETRAADFKTYDLTYEFEDGELISARLISPLGRSKGTLANAETKKTCTEQLENGSLTLRAKTTPPYVIRAARFADGRHLLLLENIDGQRGRRNIYVGKIGSLKKVDLVSGVQGGASFAFTTAAGEQIDLPSGSDRFKFPSFNGEPLGYIDPGTLPDMDALGLGGPVLTPHLDPFCPELRKSAPSVKAGPKP